MEAFVRLFGRHLAELINHDFIPSMVYPYHKRYDSNDLA